MKKVFYFVMMILSVAGLIGGIGYLCYYHQYIFAVGVAVMGFMAYGTFKEYYKKLTE